MARPARGMEVLEKAKAMLRTAGDANQVRICQAVIFPLEDKLSIEQTAKRIGRSVSWVSHNRNAFIAANGFPDKAPPGGRNHANMSLAEEQEFLKPFIEKAKNGQIVIVNEIHCALEQHLKRHVALGSAYNLLHRHEWRKLSPRKRHVKADVSAQEEWKKTSRISEGTERRLDRRKFVPADVSRRGEIWAHNRRATLLVS